MLAVTQPSAGAALVAPGAEVELLPSYEISISAECPEPEIVSLWLACAADWDYATSLPHELPIGGFADDMEAGIGAWTHAPGGGGFVDQWHRSSEKNCTPGGLWSWKQGDAGAGTYARLCDGCLVSAPVPLAATTRLRFMHWMQAEVSAAHQGYCYDGGRVEISIDGGAWQAISPEGGYPYRIRAGGTPGPFPAETPVYSGEFGWSAALFVLESAGETARFRFRFGSDGADNLEGWYIDDVEISGTDGGSGDVDGDWRPLALHPVLMPSSPNPFHPETRLTFELPRATAVDLRVFDAGGRLVRTLVQGVRPAGIHQAHWDGVNQSGAAMPAGVYYCRLQTALGSLTRSMTLLR